MMVWQSALLVWDCCTTESALPAAVSLIRPAHHWTDFTHCAPWSAPRAGRPLCGGARHSAGDLARDMIAIAKDGCAPVPTDASGRTRRSISPPGAIADGAPNQAESWLSKISRRVGRRCQGEFSRRLLSEQLHHRHIRAHAGLSP